MSSRGFILHPTYRILRARGERRPVVHLYGVLEDGQTFLVTDDREVPRFYVRERDRATARELGARPLADTDLLTLRDEPVVRVEIPTPPDTPPLRDLLHRQGIPTYEADVRFALRYLIDRGVRSSVEIQGEVAPGRRSAESERRSSREPKVDWVFRNPELAPGDFTPRLRVLSFDIETDREGRVLAISLWGCGAQEVWILGLDGEDPGALPPVARRVEGERQLIEAFVRRVQELDPDVLTGWNVIAFDLDVLKRRAEQHRVSFDLGRGPGLVRIEAPSQRAGARATVTGRVVLDGPQLLRGAFIRMDSYSLNSVAREVLGEGKTLQGSNRVEQIWETFRSDRPRFVEYALTDARLVVDILDRLQLVELSIERSRLTGMPLDRVHASVASFDYLYLSELGKLGRVGPTVGHVPPEPIQAGGGHVLAPRPGLHENVLVLDFKSLYPSLIRTFQIDPLGYLPNPSPEDDPIRAPNGACFRRQPGILTQLIDPLFERREAAKRAGDRVAAQAIKILMNSFYGVLGTSVCRFASGELATAITSFGREVLLWTKGQLEGRGYEVLYGDTDSLFVASGREDRERARLLGERLAAELNRELADWIADRWRVESRLELEFERLYLKLLLPEMRHGQGGARKRYAGLVAEGGREEVVFVGMEVVRRDWTELAHDAQRELYQRLFFQRPVEEYLHRLVAQLRAGACDGDLVYRKWLRKPLDEYTETTPPHVAAARKMSKNPGRRISYVWTTNGPEPAEERQSPFDYQHYVDKQLRPVAEPVLAVLGLDFEEVIGDRKQMSLF